MSADTHELIQQSLQGDQRAFGQIVERYQGAVSAMAYSVTGNLAQSEDLAQEAFIIAWKKLGALQKHESLSAWLCGIARNLARDWMRTQAARPTVSMEHVDESAQTESESAFRQRERADLVWTALAEIPENYREPLILFYRQGESIRDIAEALELSEDSVKQRLSRGRKLLRAEVARTVEDTLADTRPGKAFTAGVIAALPALYGAKAGAAEMATTSAKAVAAPAAMGALMKIALPIAAVGAVALGGVWWGLGDARSTNTDTAGIGAIAQSVANDPVSGEIGAALDTVPAPAAAASTPDTSPEATLATNTGATVSGLVVYRDTGLPAPGVRVLMEKEENEPRETFSDERGRFTFVRVPAGEYALMAYDAQYDEMPEDDFRSEHVPLTITEGEVSPEVRIDVPPGGGVLNGRITDANTGAPLANINVEVFRVGPSPILSGKSKSDGSYRVVGIQSGSWYVNLDRNNPIFHTGTTNSMETITVGNDLTARLDFAVDRGVPIRGRVVDGDGQPVADAIVEAELFLGEARKSKEKVSAKSCYTRANNSGEFTFWGALSEDRAVMSARTKELASHIANVTLAADGNPESITLTLLPKAVVSGHFMDEQGRPVPAQLWYRPVHSDGSGQWHGQASNPESTFSAELAQGAFELKGRAKGLDFGMEELTQTVELGPEPREDFAIKVATKSDLTGPHQLTGRVVDEQDQPLRDCRLYLQGMSRTNQGSFQETHTSDDGHFAFKGLLDDVYRIYATPGEPYEKFAGFDEINPAEASEITIVARRAATIRGRVIDEITGKPVTQFELDFGEVGFFGRETHHGPDSPSVNSDSGEFSFSPRLDVDWYLRVSATGYASQRQTGPALSPDEESELLEFKLAPARIVRGNVTNAAGESLSGALVFVNDLDIGQRRGPENATAQTDTEGSFVITSIPEGVTDAYIQKDGYANAHVPVAEEMRVVLYEGGVIQGRVTVGGAPPDGEVMVAAMALNASLAEANTETILGARDVKFAKVSGDGTYRLEHLMDLAYQLQVTSSGGALGNRRVLPAERLEASNGITVTFDMDIPWGGAVIEGVVTKGGEPVSGAQISCVNGDTQLFVTSGAVGEYRFEGLIAGSVTIAEFRPANELEGGVPPMASETTLELKADEILKHDIELPR